MKISEILGKLSEIVAQQEQAQGQSPNTIAPPARLQAVAVPNVDNTEAEVMMPPLQQKLEILKKVADIGNFYDQDEECCPGTEQSAQPNELDVMRKMAGIQIAAGDNDVLE
jgi:hypothetical protein